MVSLALLRRPLHGLWELLEVVQLKRFVDDAVADEGGTQFFKMTSGLSSEASSDAPTFCPTIDQSVASEPGDRQSVVGELPVIQEVEGGDSAGVAGPSAGGSTDAAGQPEERPVAEEPPARERYACACAQQRAHVAHSRALVQV